MVPPLNTSLDPWLFQQMHRLTVGAKPCCRPVRQEPLPLRRLADPLLHDLYNHPETEPPHWGFILWGPLGRLSWFPLGCFCKRDPICFPPQLTTDEEAATVTLWPSELLVPCYFLRPHMKLHTQAGHISSKPWLPMKTTNPNIWAHLPKAVFLMWFSRQKRKRFCLAKDNMVEDTNGS